VSWAKVLQLEVVNCLLDPGSDFRLHRQWYVDTAMDEFVRNGLRRGRQRTGCIAVWIGCCRTNRSCLFWLKQKWADLFDSDFEVLLYDLTSTYFEGEMEQNPKAKPRLQSG